MQTCSEKWFQPSEEHADSQRLCYSWKDKVNSLQTSKRCLNYFIPGLWQHVPPFLIIVQQSINQQGQQENQLGFAVHSILFFFFSNKSVILSGFFWSFTDQIVVTAMLLDRHTSFNIHIILENDNQIFDWIFTIKYDLKIVSLKGKQDFRD